MHHSTIYDTFRQYLVVNCGNTPNSLLWVTTAIYEHECVVIVGDYL